MLTTAKTVCSVCDHGCECPAGWRAGSRIAENTDRQRLPVCYKCGEPTCRKCSRIVNRRRICNRCRKA